MPRYLAEDVYHFLKERGVSSEGDETDHERGYFTSDGMPLTFPKPIDGFFDADVVDRILADRWIWTGPPRLKRYPD